LLANAYLMLLQADSHCQVVLTTAITPNLPLCLLVLSMGSLSANIGAYLQQQKAECFYQALRPRWDEEGSCRGHEQKKGIQVIK